MNKLGAILLAILFVLTSCHKHEEWDNTPIDNFNALWTIIDEHYCFFEYKDIDWNAIGEKYRARVSNDMTAKELFVVCSDMVNELHDGHTNLISSWDVSHYRFWEDYPANYNQRIIEEHYLNYNFKSSGGIDYAIMDNNMGYMYYGSFAVGLGDGNLDHVLVELAGTDGLIIDVRNNGGGLLTNAETLIARFIEDKIYAGAISHKTGPGHNDFSKPYDYYFSPADAGRMRYLKPIVILTNRSSYSATNNFVSIMKYRPNVKIVGDCTGGGSGMPFTSELPNGWTIRFSACSITDPEGNITEWGVEPSPGCRLDNTPEDTYNNRDAILEHACATLRTMITLNH